MGQANVPRMQKKQAAAYVFAVLVLFGLAIALMGIHLENQVIMAYDEARHGVSAYEMIRSGDFIVHTYQGAPDFWNLKPPLSFWLIALHFQLFGYSCAAFRLHSVIAACFTLLAVTLWTKKRCGAVASVVVLAFLVVNPALYGLNFARTGEADALHTLFVTLSMLCMLSSRRNVRWLYGAALGFGFSFMAKSYHAAIIPMICLLYLICTKTLYKLRLKNYLLLVFFGLLPIAPWAVARYLRDGFSFFASMITTDVGARMVAEVPGEQASWTFYVEHLLGNPAVVLYTVLCGALFLWQRIRKKRLGEDALGLFLWAMIPVLLYSLSTFKLYHYIVPVMVPISIAGGLAALGLIRQLRRRQWRAVCCALLVLGMGWQTYENAKFVLSRDDKGSVQTTLVEALERDLHSGRHMYIQYGVPREDGGGYRTVWMQNDMLRALLSGDVICLDGGAEAFEADEEMALLIIDKQSMDQSLLEYYPVYYETGYQMILEN